MKHILLVEDDAGIAGNLTALLSSEGFVISHAATQREVSDITDGAAFDLALVDISLPDGSGFAVYTIIKQHMDIPVIFLTASDDEASAVTGLDMGADDYITKPFSLAVLRARVNTQLRRKAIQETAVCLGKYRFDFQCMEFYAEGRPVELSKTEQKLLRIFIENRGITLSRGSLVDRVWTDGAEYVDENALSVTVKRLRDKLGAKDDIKTVYGKGYMWVKEDE